MYELLGTKAMEKYAQHFCGACISTNEVYNAEKRDCGHNACKECLCQKIKCQFCNEAGDLIQWNSSTVFGKMRIKIVNMFNCAEHRPSK